MQGPILHVVSILATSCLAIGSLVADEDLPPYFISNNYVRFTIGEVNQFIVEAGGDPAPSFGWSGNLPAGITFVPNGAGTATLSGGLPGEGGSYYLDITASNGVGPDAEESLFVEVYETTTIITANQATFQVGESGQFSITTSGGYPEPTSIALTGGSLPAGLVFSAEFNNGLIQGMPAEGTAGTYNFQVVAHSDAGDTLQEFTLTVDPAPPALPPVPRPVGLVGWWTADGNAIDLQNDNNGTLNGGASFAAGRVNRAFLLNGSSGHIAVGNPGTLKVRAVTIEAWIKPTSLPANGEMAAIATKSNHNPAKTSIGDAYGLYLTNNNGTLQLRAEINPTSGAELNLQGGSLTPGQWAHVAVAYDNGAGIFSLYVNGIPVAQDQPGHFIVASDVNVMIGRENDNSMPRYFAGLIDELSIYNRGLSPTEISIIYHARENGKLKAPQSVSPPVNLLAWWSADGSLIDLQGDRAASLPPGGRFGPGMVGQAFDLYGANTGVLIPAESAWNFGTEQFTIATWIRFASPDSFQLIAAHEQPGVGLGWRFLFNGFTLQFQFPGASVGVFPVVPAAQQWYHLAVTRRGSTYRFYVDGLQVGGDQMNATPIPSVNGPLSLGYSPGFPIMGGRIDEFQIAHRALTSQEIAAIHQAANSGVSKTFTLYVTNAGNGTVMQMDAAGNVQPFADGLSNPLGIALNAQGVVHVAENGLGRIVKFAGSNSTASFVAALTDPHGIAFDAQGNLFVAARSQNNILSFDANGAPLGLIPNGPATLHSPTGLAFDHLDHLHVSNQGDDTIAHFDGISWSLGSASPLLGGPGGMNFSREGNLLIANAIVNSLIETDADGLGTLVAGPGAGLQQPRDLACDAEGNHYITNAQTDIIRKMDTAGVFSTFATLPVGSAPAFIALRQRSPMTPLVKVANVQLTSDGIFILRGQSLPNALVTIRATTELAIPAVTIGETTADNTGAFEFQDNSAGTLPRRFYMAYW